MTLSCLSRKALPLLESQRNIIVPKDSGVLVLEAHFKNLLQLQELFSNNRTPIEYHS